MRLSSWQNLSKVRFFHFQVLNRDTLAPFLFLICLDDIIQASIYQIKENDFSLKKTKTKQYSPETSAHADYSDNLVPLSNTPAQAESLLPNLKQAASLWSLCILG